MTKLYIDDMRRPIDTTWNLVTDTAEAIEYVTTHGCPHYISFDYCLACGRTIMPFIEWLIEKDKADDGTFIPADFEFDSHSSSLCGTKQILSVLGGYLKSRKIKR